MRIETSFDHPPIPARDADWSAVDRDSYDGAEDAHPRCQIIGRGATEQEAINNLVDELIAAAEEHAYAEGQKDGQEQATKEAAERLSDSLKRIDELGEVCGEAYQAAAILAVEAGRFGDDDVVKLLDNLSDNAMTHQDVLPFASKPTRLEELEHGNERLTAYAVTTAGVLRRIIDHPASNANDLLAGEDGTTLSMLARAALEKNPRTHNPACVSHDESTPARGGACAVGGEPKGEPVEGRHESTPGVSVTSIPKERWAALADAEGDCAVSAGADLWLPAFLTAVRKLTVAGRTTGGVAGRDEGLCAALDEVEALLPPLVTLSPDCPPCDCSHICEGKKTFDQQCRWK
jgi:hypothetical protein